jgi:hypothetical protein
VEEDQPCEGVDSGIFYDGKVLGRKGFSTDSN